MTIASSKKGKVKYPNREMSPLRTGEPSVRTLDDFKHPLYSHITEAALCYNVMCSHSFLLFKE